MKARDIHCCNVCVIGGAGFLGSHLVDHLIEDRDCGVTVLDNLITGKEKHLHDRARFIWYDIRESEEELIRILRKHQIHYVFNYAAEPYIPECFERPLHFFDINAVAVLRVLNACERLKIPLLQVSSAEIYGDSKGKIAEDAQVTPHSTYGVSKAAADGLVQVRAREAGVMALALRQFNCVGERETHEYVIPEIISQINSKTTYEQVCHACRPDARAYVSQGTCARCGKTALCARELVEEVSVKLGNNSFRDFLYAGDAVKMAVELLERGEWGQVYNMGSEDGIKIYDLAKVLGDLMNVSVTIETDPARVRPWEIWHLQSDNTKLYNTIGYRPKVPLVEALQRTVNYFRANANKWDW